MIRTFVFILIYGSFSIAQGEFWCRFVEDLAQYCEQAGRKGADCLQLGKIVYEKTMDKQLAPKLSVFCSGVCTAATTQRNDLLAEVADYVRRCYMEGYR